MQTKNAAAITPDPELALTAQPKVEEFLAYTLAMEPIELGSLEDLNDLYAPPRRMSHSKRMDAEYLSERNY